MNEPILNETQSSIAQQIARVASQFQEQRTGHPPRAVTVVVGADTLVVTLHDALSPAEKALVKSASGATRVQEFHRQLFANSSDEMRQEIMRITGRRVREAAAEIETVTGTVVHAFATGTMVQVFLLTPDVHPDTGAAGVANDVVERAEDDGLRVNPDASFHDDSSPST